MHSTKYGVLVVQPGLLNNGGEELPVNDCSISRQHLIPSHLTHRWQHRDKELTSVAVWTRIGHADRIRSIVFQCGTEFILELTAPDRLTTGAGSSGIARLNHETLDDTMEDVPIIVTVFGMHAKVFHRLRALFSEEPHMDVTHRRVNNGVIVQFLRT